MQLRLLLILITVSFIMLAVYSSTSDSSVKYTETKEAIVLRKVIHELMLSSGDSSSRVLPVKQISAGEFHLFPEKPLSIAPDSFVQIVTNTIQEGKLIRNFTASVIQCQSKEVVFGFAASSTVQENIVSCLGRTLPEDCYYLSFIFAPEETSFLASTYFYVGVAAIALLALLFVWRNKRLKSTGIPAVPDTPLDENNPAGLNIIPVGKYLFNPEQQSLELDGATTALTVKECKVLSILASAPNSIIERELLQKEVWENEGVIVTRSLDMFISKLRKKLSGDTGIKILNVHGRGYKLCLQ